MHFLFIVRLGNPKKYLQNYSGEHWSSFCLGKYYQPWPSARVITYLDNDYSGCHKNLIQ